MATKDEQRRDKIRTFCTVGSLLVALAMLIVSICALVKSNKAEKRAINAENISKNVESTVSKLTIVTGPAGINQSGGQGSFQIGDMRIGTGQPQPSRVVGLESAKTTFSEIANRDLVAKAIVLVDGIRNLANSIYENSRTNSGFSTEFLTATNQVEKEKAWVASGNRSLKFWNEVKFTYNSRLKVDAVLLRDEIRSRLPKARYTNDQIYEDPSLSDFHEVPPRRWTGAEVICCG